MPISHVADWEAAADYCIPVFPNGCGGYVINNFVLRGENGTSIADFYTGCASGSYDDRTAISNIADLASGNNYEAEVNRIENGRIAIWIDFNDDGVFDASERVAAMAIDAYGNPPVPISIPENSNPGLHRMRVMVGQGGNPENREEYHPCNNGSSPRLRGEVHDYTVHVLNSRSTPPVTGVEVTNITQTTAKISWTPGGSENTWEVEYGRNSFNYGEGTVVTVTGSPNVVLENLTDASYYKVFVTAVVGNEKSFPSAPLFFYTHCYAMSDIVVSEINDFSAVISWTPGGNEQHWKLAYGSNGQPGSWSEVEVSGYPSYILDDLSPGTTYGVMVKTSCANPNSDPPFVGPVYFTTTYTVDCIKETPREYGGVHVGGFHNYLYANDFVVFERDRFSIYTYTFYASLDFPEEVEIDEVELHFYKDSESGGPGQEIGDELRIVPTVARTSNPNERVVRVKVDFNPPVVLSAGEDDTVFWIGTRLHKTGRGDAAIVSTRTLNTPNPMYRKTGENWQEAVSYDPVDGVMALLGSCDTLGIEDESFNGFVYFPNPVNDNIYLESVNTIQSVSVYNLLGQLVISKNLNVSQTSISMEHLQSGIYMMEVTIDGNRQTFKIVKD